MITAISLYLCGLISYQHTGSVVTYGNAKTSRVALFGSAQITYDWDSATVDNNANPAIHAIVVPSKLY